MLYALIAEQKNFIGRKKDKEQHNRLFSSLVSKFYPFFEG